VAREQATSGADATLLLMLIPKVEYTAMLLGATGNVGGHILHLLVQSPMCKKVVVVTRRNVAALANPKVQQVVVNMDKLEEVLAPHAKDVDIALAAWRSRAGDDNSGRRRLAVVDQVPPRHRRQGEEVGGAQVRLPRALPPGRDPRQLQHAFCIGFVMPLLHWAMPSRYHSIHKNDLARAMVAQSEQAFLALAQGTGPTAPAVKILEYKEMARFVGGR